MQVILQKQTDPRTIYASVRLNAKEHAALKEYMHCTGERVEFPHGVILTYRGRGWYRLIPTRHFEAIAHMVFAVRTIKRFCLEQEEAVEKEIKALMPMMLDTSLKPTAFVPETGIQFTAPVSKGVLSEHGIHKLQSLAERFGKSIKAA